jgi:hypothetical protein
MSNYQDLVRDLPTRCLELHNALESDGAEMKREVTLLLSVASLAFVVPYERLAEQAADADDPAFIQPRRDPERFPEAARRLSELLDARFADSLLSPTREPEQVQFGECPFTTSDPRDWPELLRPSRPVSETHLRVRDVLDVIRNGFAHGNILTRAEGDNQISEVVFIRGGKRVTKNERAVNPALQGVMRHPYLFLRCTPAGLRTLFRTWCAFLQGLPIPTKLAAAPDRSTDEEAAAA